VNRADEADVAALAALDSSTRFELRMPKVETTAELDAVGRICGQRPLTAIIESARGVENAAAIAAHPAVTRLALGESDLASELGSTDRTVIDFARVRLLIAARAAGLDAPMLSAYPDIRDLDGLRADSERGRALGWFGRVAIHPSQLPVIAEVFAPSASELVWARDVVAAVEEGGVATLANGEMVDPAMLGRARMLLRRAAP
jgi:citrate lyase subunit beta / citryl-CoA lyase